MGIRVSWEKTREKRKRKKNGNIWMKEWKYYYNIFTIFLMIPSKISNLVSIEHWWSQGLILKANNKSQETGGDRPKVL